MQRRHFLGLTAAGVAHKGLAPKEVLLASQRSEKPRPNIIFIMADDHAPHGLSCYGSALLSTPNLDKLAAEGMRFTNALGVNSLCAPARACLLTGKHSHLNGKETNHDHFDPSQQTFPGLLQNAGYQTAIVGKWHLGSKDAPRGFDYYKVMKGHGSYFNSLFRETGKEEWYNQEGYLTNVITDSAIAWLEQRDQQKPFCLLVHHKAPHGPDIHEEKHAKLFENETISAPETLHDDWATREPLRTGECEGTKLINISWRQNIYQELKERAPKEKKPRTEVIYQQMIKGYMRLVASLDENIGRLLDYIDESGLRENTMVIYTSDNGFFLGDHGLYNKMWMYEESMRLPLLVRYPGVVAPGTTNDELISMLDFAPTFLDVARGGIPEDLQGRSILRLLHGEPLQEWREGVYYHFYRGYGTPEHYGVRTKTHKLLHFPGFGDGNYWELFDLAEDAAELTNVYGRPEYKKAADQMHALLESLQAEMKVPAR